MAEMALRTFYMALKALMPTSPSCLGLPIELVLYIFQLAEFTCPWPDKSLYTKVESDRELAGKILACNAMESTRSWLRTPPIPGRSLRSIWRVEPRIHPAEPVMSRTHAFKPDELLIRIATGSGPSFQYRKRQDGAELFWLCRTKRNTVLTESLQELDYRHEVWQWLEPGDRLEIAVEASSWHFPNVRSEWGVSLQIFTLWEPSAVMLSLICDC
ncbi:hypothetical protein BDV93DRAFT_527595 [Ceratobasidium sp. AG-I]|nr:hypothetical protein BDV93DRAFT_527595 [Ceratobasidium sp. AG-I]